MPTIKPAKPTKTPILTKYKKPERDVEEERKTEEADRVKRAERERQRLQGRGFPKQSEEGRERELMRIATKGVVELFNTVAEFQTNAAKEVVAEKRAKDVKYHKAVMKTGSSYLNQSN